MFFKEVNPDKPRRGEKIFAPTDLNPGERNVRAKIVSPLLHRATRFDILFGANAV